VGKKTAPHFNIVIIIITTIMLHPTASVHLPFHRWG